MQSTPDQNSTGPEKKAERGRTTASIYLSVFGKDYDPPQEASLTLITITRSLEGVLKPQEIRELFEERLRILSEKAGIN